MLCASACITSMICFTLEKTCQGHRAMDDHVHGNTHRMAAPGDAASFPLPWQDLLQPLHEGAVVEELGKSASLARTGKELTHVLFYVIEHVSRRRYRHKHSACRSSSNGSPQLCCEIDSHIDTTWP